MLAYFVDGYRKENALTPDSILVLFIVSVLGAAWAVATLFTYHRSRNNASFVAFVDLLFVGAFIGGVYALRGVARWDCTNVSRGGNIVNINGSAGSLTVNGINVNTDKHCAMLKAAWAFGIMNCIFFFITAILAVMVGRGHGSSAGGHKTYVRETHYTRHGHRRGSHSSHSRRSHSGHRRAYV
jgi:hypothetical protein